MYVLSDTKSQLESQFHFGSNKDDEFSGSSIIELFCRLSDDLIRGPIQLIYSSIKPSKIILQFIPVIYGTGKSTEWQFHIVFKHNSV